MISPALNSHQLALLQTHIAVLLLGGTALFSKLIPLDATAISAGRAFVACILLAILVKITEKRIRLLSLKDYAIGMVLGVLMALHWVTYFFAMQYSTVAVGMIALYTFPVLTVLIEPVLDKRLPKIRDLALALLVFFGVALMVPELSFDSDYTFGIALGVLSAVFFTFRNIINKRQFAHYSGAKNMMLQSAVVTIVLLPFSWMTFEQNLNWSIGSQFLVLGIFFTALPHVLIVLGLKHLQAKSMGLIACLSPFYGAVLAVIILDEIPDLSTMIGGAIVVFAAIFETLSVKRKQ